MASAATRMIPGASEAGVRFAPGESGRGFGLDLDAHLVSLNDQRSSDVGIRGEAGYGLWGGPYFGTVRPYIGLIRYSGDGSLQRALGVDLRDTPASQVNVEIHDQPHDRLRALRFTLRHRFLTLPYRFSAPRALTIAKGLGPVRFSDHNAAVGDQRTLAKDEPPAPCGQVVAGYGVARRRQMRSLVQPLADAGSAPEPAPRRSPRDRKPPAPTRPIRACSSDIAAVTPGPGVQLLAGL